MGCTSTEDDRESDYYSQNRSSRSRRDHPLRESEGEEEKTFKDFEEIGSNFYYIIKNYNIKYRWENDWRRN